MQRPPFGLLLQILLMLVVLLLGVVFLREPRLQRTEEYFLRWLLKNSDAHGPSVPLTVVEIDHDRSVEHDLTGEGGESAARSGANAVSPMEFALFLQSVLAFQPTVVGFENVLKWRETEKEQEQMLIDQAMRVPRLLLASELTSSPDPDAPGPEIPGFTNVTGKRGDLIEYSGVGRQPNDELRLIATPGFTNLPEEIADSIHVPLLFRYRGEVIPSFALQAVLLWLRITPAEVSIDLNSHITLPRGRAIPIRSDGTLLISPNAGRKARHLNLSDLLVAAQQRDTGKESDLGSLREQIVLARTPADPLSPPDVFAATIATIQSSAYVRRVSMIFDCIILLLAAAIVGKLRDLSRVDLVLGGIAFTAAYCLAALAVVSRWLIWLPGWLPLGAVWLLVLVSIVIPHRYRVRREVIAMPPPVP
jgi:hypothetical protein